MYLFFKTQTSLVAKQKGNKSTHTKQTGSSIQWGSAVETRMISDLPSVHSQKIITIRQSSSQISVFSIFSLSKQRLKRSQVEIVQLNEKSGNFESNAVFEHQYPPTKLMWIPDLVSGVRVNHKTNSYPDLLATTGDYLRIW